MRLVRLWSPGDGGAPLGMWAGGGVAWPGLAATTPAEAPAPDCGDACGCGFGHALAGTGFGAGIDFAAGGAFTFTLGSIAGVGAGIAFVAGGAFTGTTSTSF